MADKTNYDHVLIPMAKAGYETMFVDKWEDLSPKAIERDMWKSIAKKMLEILWVEYQMEDKHG